MITFLRRRKAPDAASCSSLKDVERNRSCAPSGGELKDKCYYRAQLEQEIGKLQKQLQEEINLHVALTSAVEDKTWQPLNQSRTLPQKATELLSGVATLESAVSMLEDELISLQHKLCQEKNERRLAEHHLVQRRTLSCSSFSCSSNYSWDEQISSLRAGRHYQASRSLSSTLDHEHMPYITMERLDDMCSEVSDVRASEEFSWKQPLETEEQRDDSIEVHSRNYLDRSLNMGLHNHPNKLSEEMVRCMINIFLRLAKPTPISSMSSPSVCVPSPSPKLRHFPRLFFRTFSTSSITSSRSPCPNIISSQHLFYPYRIHGTVMQANIGIYSSAAEVTYIAVGKKQLEYAAEALRQFRFLVEQLAKVNPDHMGCKEKMAFWINVYNALLMHAYLAYGVPKSEKKLFALMQKASYTVGGYSFSALDIEYNLLKRIPPAYHPQLALVLALHHHSKLSEEHKKFSVVDPDPLVMFALSCGMYSSPAVRIFTANNVKEELQNSLRDYIQASVGLNNGRKLLVPKLLYCYAKDVVKDSLLGDWICRFLTLEQASIFQGSTLPRKQRLLGARSFTVVAFNKRFRYLFLPEKDEHFSNTF